MANRKFCIALKNVSHGFPSCFCHVIFALMFFKQKKILCATATKSLKART